MAGVKLSIEPDLCGPISVGTVGVVRLVGDVLGLSLAEAAAHVNRCVFDGETIELAAPSIEVAERLVAALGALATQARITATVVPSCFSE